MRKSWAFTLIELLVTIAVIALVIGILIPALRASRLRANQRKNDSQMRGVHQGCLIYTDTNAYFFPGIDSACVPVPASVTTTGSSVNDGTVVGSRYWILLTGSFIGPQLLLNPADTLVAWSTNTVTTGNYSYCMLSITTNANDSGRQLEWKDNANPGAVQFSDRNVGTDNSDANIRSLWTTSPGDWRGSCCWGDGHVSFELSNRLTTPTVYNGSTQTNDNLFASNAGIGISDNSTLSTANAFMVYFN